MHVYMHVMNNPPMNLAYKMASSQERLSVDYAKEAIDKIAKLLKVNLLYS